MSFVQPFVVTQPPRLKSWSPAMKVPRGPVEVPQGDTDGHQPVPRTSSLNPSTSDRLQLQQLSSFTSPFLSLIKTTDLQRRTGSRCCLPHILVFELRRRRSLSLFTESTATVIKETFEGDPNVLHATRWIYITCSSVSISVTNVVASANTDS